jgi:hypothetical protein
MRQDLDLDAKAQELGFTVERGAYNDNEGNCYSFTKENKVIWYTCGGRWAVADLINNKHTNHRYYDDLEEALRKEK